MIVFIDSFRDYYGAEGICRNVDATERGLITSRGYSAAKNRAAFLWKLRDAILGPEIMTVRPENYSFYGIHKIWRAMMHADWKICRDQVARLMRNADLQ